MILMRDLETELAETRRYLDDIRGGYEVALADRDAAVARADELTRRLDLVSRWLADEQDAGLQVPVPVRAALSAAPEGDAK